MSRNKIIIALLIMLSIGIISLYTTFAYQGENMIAEKSNADYNLIYSLKDENSKEISVRANEEKIVDIKLTNTYNSVIKYGMYYYLTTPKKLPENVSITLATDSVFPLEDTINPTDSKTISIKIKNGSEHTVNLILGALIGFENGNIEDLVTEGTVLIK